MYYSLVRKGESLEIDNTWGETKVEQMMAAGELVPGEPYVLVYHSCLNGQIKQERTLYIFVAEETGDKWMQKVNNIMCN